MNKDETTNVATDTVAPSVTTVAAPSRKKTAATKKPAKVKPASSKPTVKSVDKTPKPAEAKVDNFDRDFGRYRFQGVDRPKGRTVLAIIQKYAEDKNPTLAELKDDMKDAIGRSSFDTIMEISAAKRVNSSDGKKRYFVKDGQTIKTKDGKTACVTNQIGAENMKAFIKFAKTLGYNTTSSPKAE